MKFALDVLHIENNYFFIVLEGPGANLADFMARLRNHLSPIKSYNSIFFFFGDEF